MPFFISIIDGDSSVSVVSDFATPWTAARQASLSWRGKDRIINSKSLLKLMPIESVMPSKHLVLCRPLLLLPSIFPSIRVFSMSQSFASGGQSIEASASASVLPMNIQDCFLLGLTSLISLLSKGSQESSPVPQFEDINSLALSLFYHPALKLDPLEKG